MFKKRIALLVTTAVFACVIFVPPVRAAAESALSIFRVADTKIIRITAGDLQELMTLADDAQEADPEAIYDSELSQVLGKAQSGIKPLTSVNDFAAFPFSLPAALKAETPELYAAGTSSQTIILDTVKINAQLSMLGAALLVDNSLNGTSITINTPPAVAAIYDGLTLVATQNVYVDAPDGVVNSLWSSILSIPAISADLRGQLAAIDPKTRDIYLPVIDGLGRETDLGKATGYIYNTGELAQVFGMIPGLVGNERITLLEDINASALVWTKDGVLYCLTGQKSDSELSQIARSMR